VTGPLAATLARLDAADEDYSYVAGDPREADGTGWSRLDQAIHDGSILDQWFRAFLAGEAKGLRNVAGALLASYLSDTITQTVFKALTTEGRVWPLQAEVLAVRLHPDAWFDGIAVRTTRVRVLPGDPAAGHPDAEVVDDDAALRELVADELVALAAPIFAAVRQRAPFGMPGMWGNLVDAIAAGALWHGRNRRPRWDATAAYATAAALIDAMAARVPLIRPRPPLERVEWSGGTAWMAPKTACCLLYHAYDLPRPESYCNNCPLRDGDSRRAKWASWLEEQATAAKGGA
jgi:hypothetical protein